MSVTPENWDKVKALFEDVLELNPPERSAFLSQRALDPGVRAEVERLLLEHEQAGTFLSAPVLGDLFPRDKPPRKFQPGDSIAGRFKIIRFIAAGGMGEVYEAQDIELREHVAIKTILPDAIRDPKVKSRFRREVQLARKVTHPNVCRIFDLYRIDGGERGEETLLVSMELLHGKTLSECLKEDGPLEIPEALSVLLQLASALVAAHDVGVIHGDLKPGNVFLVDPKRAQGATRPVITDFGLAIQAIDTDATTSSSFATLSVEHGFFGTPLYMAPEQLQGQRPTIASDIYAFGLILYEVITGIRPFPDKNIPLLINDILSRQPLPPSKLSHNVPKEFDAIALKALERDPKNRYRSARELTKRLQHLESAIAESASGRVDAVSPKQVHRRHCRIFRYGLSVRIALVVLSALLLGLSVRFTYERFIKAKKMQHIAVIAHPALSYYIVAQEHHEGRPTGAPFRVSENRVFTPGMAIHFVFRSFDLGYLYIVNEGPASTESSPALNILFPSPSTNDGSAQLTPGRNLTIPDAGPFVFDNKRGSEKIWLVWSRQAVGGLESLKRWANFKDRGRVKDLAEARSARSLLIEKASFSPDVNRDSMNQTTLAMSGDILVHLVKLDHE